jgi:hypothetical protein
MPGAPARRSRPKGVFRGNRGLLILLIDVVIIAVIAIIYRQFLFSPAFEGDLAGYRMTLRGLGLQNRVVAELVIERVDDEAEEGTVFVLLRAGQGETRLSGALTRGTTTLEGAVLVGEQPAEIFADVTIGDESIELRRRLSGDR